MTGEQRVLAVEHDRANTAFDDVGVELDAAIVEETGESFPMVQGIAHGISDQCLGRDSGEPVCEPREQAAT